MKPCGFEGYREAFYDGELSPADRSLMETHLKNCTDCQAWQSQWQAISGRLFTPKMVPSSEVFVRQVMDRLAETEKPSKPFVIFPVQWFAPALGIAAMLLLSLIPVQESMSAEAFFGSESSVLLNKSPQADEVLSFVLEAS